MLDLMQQAKLQDKEMSPEEFQQRISERVKALAQKKLDMDAVAAKTTTTNHMMLAEQNSEIIQGLSKLIKTLSINSAAPPSNSNPAPNARPIMPDRPRTPGRQDRARSPSPYRGNRDGNRGRDAYRRDGENRDRFRSQSADNRYRNRTPQRNDRYRSPGQMQGIKSIRRRLNDDDLGDIFSNISSVMRNIDECEDQCKETQQSPKYKID